MIMRRPRAPDLTLQRHCRDGIERVVGETQPHVFVFEEALVLLDDRVLRLGQNLHQSGLVQILERGHHWQTADELRNEAVFDQIVRLQMPQHIDIAPVADSDRLDLFVSSASS